MDNDVSRAIHVALIIEIETPADFVIKFLSEHLPYLFDRVGNAALQGGINSRRKSGKDMINDMSKLYKEQGPVTPGKSVNYGGRNIKIQNG